MMDVMDVWIFSKPSIRERTPPILWRWVVRMYEREGVMIRG
jgi:hypothetical protein